MVTTITLRTLVKSSRNRSRAVAAMLAAAAGLGFFILVLLLGSLVGVTIGSVELLVMLVAMLVFGVVMFRRYL